MGSVYNRGTRAKPNWYISFRDRNGKRKAVPSHQPTKVLARRYLERVEARIADGMVGIEESSGERTCGDLFEDWVGGLTNRNAKDDESRMRRALLPEFKNRRPSEITTAVVLRWIDKQRATKEPLSDASIRHNVNLLSRFFAWAIERDHATTNPVRQIPIGKRPKASPRKTDVPWLKDDALVRRIISKLETPVDYMFYLGNRSGLRTGEIAGLRMSDFGFLSEGVIRVRFSYSGPLKEDKNSDGKIKWVPASDDCEQFLGPWLDDRRAEGAGPEDLVFPGPRFPEKPCRKEWIESRWEPVREKLKLGKLTWYQATRHSFVSRLLEAGASLDEVSAAVGHSSPVVTRRYYDHFIRDRYSPALRGGLGLGKGTASGQVIPMTDHLKR